MAWRAAFCIGLLLPWCAIWRSFLKTLTWPGMIAHFLITGLHGGTGALEIALGKAWNRRNQRWDGETS
jgi:hypothetical protein